jgi:hypothetical protein
MPTRALAALVKMWGPYIAIGATVFYVGVDRGQIGEKLEAKADKAVVAQMASDIHVIRTLVCRDHPGDSMCVEAVQPQRVR